MCLNPPAHRRPTTAATALPETPAALRHQPGSQIETDYQRPTAGRDPRRSPPAFTVRYRNRASCNAYQCEHQGRDGQGYTSADQAAVTVSYRFAEPVYAVDSAAS